MFTLLGILFQCIAAKQSSPHLFIGYEDHVLFIFCTFALFHHTAVFNCSVAIRAGFVLKLTFILTDGKRHEHNLKLTISTDICANSKSLDWIQLQPLVVCHFQILAQKSSKIVPPAVYNVWASNRRFIKYKTQSLSFSFSMRKILKVLPAVSREECM